MNSNDQTQYTIIISGETMVVSNGKTPKSHLAWRAAGLDVFVLGSLSGLKFEQAGHLAMCIAQAMHIPLISLRYQRNQASKKTTIETKRMFS